MTDVRHTGMTVTSERYRALRKTAHAPSMQDTSDNPAVSTADAMQWVLESLAPEADRFKLIADLRARAGYLCADWPLDPETQGRNDRVVLVERLSADWAARNEGA